jgi:probable HAF family extracellular repeat protein
MEDDMNRRLFLPTLAAGMALLGACGGSGDASAPDSRARIEGHARPPASVSYTATVLSLGGTSGSGRFNQPGQVAGTSTLADGTHTRAFFFDGSTLVDLGAAPGQDSTFVALNDRGQVAGYEAPANSVVHQAFLWTAAGGKMVLASSPGAFSQTPTALNNAGEVVAMLC